MKMPAFSTKHLFAVITIASCLLVQSLCSDCPEECSCTTSPPEVTCNDPNLTHVPSGVPENTTLFVIRGTKVSALRNGDLNGLPHLNTIYFDNNLISTIEAGAFVGAPNLNYIEMVQNEMRDLPSGVFGSLKKLDTVDMRWNRMKTIPKGSFKDLPELTVVYLKGNELDSIEIGAFSNISKSIVIGLQDNSIKEIRKGAFVGPQGKSANLDLTNNAISHIDGGAFSAFVNLNTLLLGNNSLETVEGAFTGLKSVGTLDLSYNKIQALSETVFSGITGMSQLNLYSNEIKTISARTFANLSSLSGLSLQNNMLEHLDGELPNSLSNLQLQNNLLTSFPNLPSSITYLDISSNPIKFLEDEQFAKFSNLKTLCLSNIKYFRDKGTVKAAILRGMGQLDTLKLASNNLARVPSTAIQQFPQMSETLDLSDNQITLLHPEDFTNLSNLYTLVLSGNNITSVPSDAFKPLSRLFSIDLSRNPLVYLGPNTFKWSGESLYSVILKDTKLRLVDGELFNSSSGVKALWLDNNDLRYLPWKVFTPLTYYGDPQEALDLEANPWLCDCQMYEYARWQKSPHGIVAAAITCQFPPELRGKTLKQVPLDQFKCNCSHFSTPNIDTTGSDTNVTSGHGAVLKCNVTACPEAVIMWSTPGGITLSSNSPHPGLEVLDDGSLVIVETGPDDGGTYSCMAANYLGQDTASVRLKVNPSYHLT